MSEALETTGTLRVRLVHDTDARNPREEYDHLTHALTLPTRHYIDVDKDGGDLEPAWRRLVDRYMPTDAVDIFERWARIFHGAHTLYDTPHDGASAVWYVLPADIEREGVTDPAALLNGERDEYRAWAEGDVYGYIVEERVTWSPVDPAHDHYQPMDTWESVDSCWGFIGYEYADAEARSAFTAHRAPESP